MLRMLRAYLFLAGSMVMYFARTHMRSKCFSSFFMYTYTPRTCVEFGSTSVASANTPLPVHQSAEHVAMLQATSPLVVMLQAKPLLHV
jgi:hypothetical protein